MRCKGNSRILENLVLAVICRWGMMMGVAILDVIYMILMEMVRSQSDRGRVSALNYQW